MLAVTDIGMVSPVGLGVASSCAAARAGILGIVALDDVRVYDDEAEEEVPVSVHRVPRMSAGLFGYARLLQLAAGAVDDLRRSRVAAGGAEADPKRLGVILVLPDYADRAAWLQQLRADPATAEGDIDPDVEQPRLSDASRRLAKDFLPELARHSGITVSGRCAEVLLGDATAFVGALERAAGWLAEGACDTCWVGGVDSYLDPGTIEALAGLRLLRTPDNPTAAIPGEIACVLSLEDPQHASGAGHTVTARIDRFARTTGATPRLADDPPVAAPLMAAMTAASGGVEPPHLVVNLNGDAVRATEWGHVMVRRTAQGLADPLSTWIAPLYFGEIGAGTGPASVALVARGWARRYAPAPRALVALMGNAADRGAVALATPQGGTA
jgi:3-oxoacyl-[acyl-carrier-protein] synthase-1